MISEAIKWLTVKRAILLICLITFLIYANSLFNGFVWDDEEEIIGNSIVHSLTNFPQILSGATFNTGGAGLSGWFFRPLRTFIVMLLYAVWGGNAFGYHLFLVSIHIFCAILIFLILQKILKQSKYKLLISLLASLLFGVHSGITEAVDYIAASSEVIYSLFNLGALYLLIRGGTEIIGLFQKISIFVLLLSGMLIKESSIVIFPIILIYLVISRHKNWKFLGLLSLFTPLLYLFLRLVMAKVAFQSINMSPIGNATLLERLLSLPLTMLAYLRLSFFPVHLAISQHFVIHKFSADQVLMPSLLVTAFFVGTFVAAYRLKSKNIFLGLIWFGIGLGPISNIFPLDMSIGERWLYFPLIGLIICLAEGISQLVAKGKKLSIFFLLTLVIIGFSLRTAIRNTNWYDGLTLYSTDVHTNPDSFDIQNNLGVELFRHGQLEEAKPHFVKSLQLFPKWYFAENNLGAIYEHEGQFSLAKEHYANVLKVSDYYLAHQNMANLLLYHESTEAAKQFTKNSLQKLPGNDQLWLTLAMSEYQLGEVSEALKAAKNAYSLNPSAENYQVFSKIQAGQSIQQ